MSSTSTLSKAKVEGVQLNAVKSRSSFYASRIEDYESLTEYIYVLENECEGGIDESCGVLRELLFGD